MAFLGVPIQLLNDSQLISAGGAYRDEHESGADQGAWSLAEAVSEASG